MIQGRAWLFGDNISTDAIIPGRFMDRIGVITDTEWAKICFYDHEPRFREEVKPGDIIVAGKNFGLGSSREMAPLALKNAGIACILAISFARIFFRNCVNLGLPVLNANQELISSVKTLDSLSVDIEKGEVHLHADSKVLPITPLPVFAKEIIDSGGLLEFAKKKK